MGFCMRPFHYIMKNISPLTHKLYWLYLIRLLNPSPVNDPFLCMTVGLRRWGYKSVIDAAQSPSKDPASQSLLNINKSSTKAKDFICFSTNRLQVWGYPLLLDNVPVLRILSLLEETNPLLAFSIDRHNVFDEFEILNPFLRRKEDNLLFTFLVMQDFLYQLDPSSRMVRTTKAAFLCQYYRSTQTF